jgi:hypothetical protein
MSTPEIFFSLELVFPTPLEPSAITNGLKNSTELRLGSLNKFFTTTPGWNEDLISHWVKCLNPEELKGYQCQRQPGRCRLFGSRLQPEFVPPEPQFAYVLNDPESHQIWWEIKATNNYKQTPYWVIQVPKQIIPDHTGIWFDSSLDMMPALYVIATANHHQSTENRYHNSAPVWKRRK